MCNTQENVDNYALKLQVKKNKKKIVIRIKVKSSKYQNTAADPAPVQNILAVDGRRADC